MTSSTTKSDSLGQGDHFPHLQADVTRIPRRQRSSSVTKSRIKIRIRPLTIRFTEAGVGDFNVQVKAQVDSIPSTQPGDLHRRDSKGKGKARALETVQDQEHEDEISALLDDLDDSVRALKAKIRLSIPQTKDRKLRLIHSGRILSDGTRLVSWLDSLDSHRRNQEFKAENGQMGVAARELVELMEDGLVGIKKGIKDLTKEEQEEGRPDHLRDQDRQFRRSSADLKGKGREVETSGIRDKKRIKVIQDVEESTAYIQCSIGDTIESKPEARIVEEEASAAANQTAPAPRGFDRLMIAANLSSEEIEEMRVRFRSSQGLVASGDALLEDEEAEHTRALEEQWIESLSPQESTTSSSNDTYSTMLEGVLTGFFFPFLPLFFLSDRSSPSSIASPNWNTMRSNSRNDERIAGHHLNNRSSHVFSEEMKQAIVFGLVSK